MTIIPFLFDVLAYSAIFVLVVLGLGVIASMMGIFNFAHGEFVLLGAYTVYLFHSSGLPVWAGMVAAPFAVGVVGLALERVVIRRFYATPIVAMLGTYAIGLALRETVRSLLSGQFYSVTAPLVGSFSFGEISISRWRTAVILITVAVMVGSYLLLTRTRFGLQVRAALENPALARASGISTSRVYAATFAFGAALAGLAGGLMVPIYAISADMGVPFLIKSFLAVMLGGMGSFEGAIAGAGGGGGGRHQRRASLGNQARGRRRSCLHYRDRDREGSAGRPFIQVEELIMTIDDRSRRPLSASRRLFLQRASLLSGMIALGGGSYLYNPKGVWAANPIKVGIATDLTGAISWGGIPNSQVAKMTIDQINKSGGLLGRPLQMILADTATNEQLAVTKVRKLVTQDKVDVVFGGITSSMRNAIKDTIVKRGKTLYIYPQLYEGKECTPYLFCTGPTPAQQCDTFIPWLIKNGGKKFYLPSADYVWPHTLNAYARTVIVKNGGEVIGEEYFPVDHNEYSATVNKIMSSGVNVVFNTTIPPGVAAFFKQLYEAGFQKKGGRLACVYYDENALNITPANEIEGLASCLDYFKAVNDSFGNQLQAEYGKLFGDKNPFTAGSGATGMYRGIKLWETAVKEAKSVKREPVAAALDHAKISNGPGGGCEMVPGTRHVKMNMYTAVSKGGKYEIVEKSKGPVMPGECA